MLVTALRERGYEGERLEAIPSGNWLRILRDTLPALRKGKLPSALTTTARVGCHRRPGGCKVARAPFWWAPLVVEQTRGE